MLDKFVSARVVDVVGPLPDLSCFVVVSVYDKMFGIQSGYADAEIAHGLLHGTAITSPYEFMSDTFVAAGIKIEKTELETAGNCLYGKIMMRSGAAKKPMRIVSSSPVAIVNSSLAAKIPMRINVEMAHRLIDCTNEYNDLKTTIEHLFPLPPLENTVILRLLSDFIDKIQFRQVAS